MNQQSLWRILEEHPIIMSVRNEEDLERALSSDLRICFVLYGSISTIPTIVQRLKARDKIVFVHDGLVDGLSTTSPEGVAYLVNPVGAHGIITTRVANAKRAKEKGLFVVYRYFLLDGMSLRNMRYSLENLHADIVEILPGVIPKLVGETLKLTNLPVVAGGLIETKKEAANMLNAGAFAVSTSNYTLWEE